MPLDPDCLRTLDLMRNANLPPVETLTPAEARANYRAARRVLSPPAAPVASVRDLEADGPAGAIPLRLYRGAGTGADDRLPALVFFHGGGWVIGGLDTHDGPCRAIANAAGCAVISVEYRLAPEHPFPAAVEDGSAALHWIAAQAGELGIDAGRIAVGGDSAGGNLAAVMALSARDGTVPPLCYQVLIYPATDFAMNTQAYARFTSGLPLTAGSTRWFADQYVADADRGDWRASPARAQTLAGTPPAFVLTAGYDPLCDEGQDYARRLERDGVRVCAVYMADQMHGFLTMGGTIRAAETLACMVGAVLRDAFSRD